MNKEKAKEMWRKWNWKSELLCREREMYASWRGYQSQFEKYDKLCRIAAKQMRRLEFLYGLKVHISAFCRFMSVS